MAWRHGWERVKETAREAISPTGQPARQSQLEAIAGHPDPWAHFLRFLQKHQDPEALYQMPLGWGPDGELVGSLPRRHCLTLGPPRTFKTTGILAPQILAAPGPVVALSTKGDLYRATAITRARMGRIWHYAPDGGPTLPGATQLRWSPITESANWDTARIIGRAMTYDAGEGTTEANYFRNSAGGLASAMLHSAALGNKSMTWLLAGLGGSSRTLRQAAEICYEHQARSAGDILTNFVERDSRTTSSIFATADTAFDAFKGDGAVRTTEDPNFDELAFVRGLPDTYNPARLISYPDSSPEARLEEMYGDQHARGWFDTIYITAGSENQAVVAPLIVGLLARIRSACFRAHGQDDLSERGARRPPLLWALDELAQLAPMSDLPGTLSEGAGQNLLISAVLQDLSQAEAKWKKDGEGFMTLFGEIAIIPGIRNEKTLRQISELSGKSWVTRYTRSTAHSSGRNATTTRTESSTEQLLANLDVSEISRGAPRDFDLGSLDPFRFLLLQSSGKRGFIAARPYYMAPWAQFEVSSMEHHAESASILEARSALIPPLLDRNGSSSLISAGGQELAERYRDAGAHIQQIRQARERCADWMSEHRLLRHYDDSARLSTTYGTATIVCPDSRADGEFLALLEALDLPWEHRADPYSIVKPAGPPTFCRELRIDKFRMGAFAWTDERAATAAAEHLTNEVGWQGDAVAAAFRRPTRAVLSFVHDSELGSFIARWASRGLVRSEPLIFIDTSNDVTIYSPGGGEQRYSSGQDT